METQYKEKSIKQKEEKILTLISVLRNQKLKIFYP